MIAANQPGNASFNPAPEVRRSFAIAKANQTISFNAIPDKVFGDEDFDITATTSAGLSVSFSVITGPASVNGNTVELTGAGTVTIAANQPGNANYNDASQVLRSFEVDKAGQVVTIEPIDGKTTLSDPFDVVATVGSGLPLAYTVTGPAVVSGATITLSGTPGEVVVTASQAGDDDYNAASASVSFTVVQGLLPQSISFDAIDDHVYGESVVLDAVADSGLPVVYELMTGNLELDGNMLSFSGVGFAAIKAVQAGNNEYQAAEVVHEFTIARADLSLVADDLSREYGQANPELTFSAEGLVYGETVAEALSDLPSVITPASGVSIPGTYVISLTGGVAANYVLSRANGSLEITKATLTVTAADA
ncbi:MAG: MBG domain-containing protein, partial [Bacteroidota bacterium]